MPRARKTQTPQAPGLEAGAAYGEVSDSLEAQASIPLPQKPPVGQAGALAPQVAPPAPAMPQGMPVEEARQFTPNITPLTAPTTNPMGAGIGSMRPPPTDNQRAAGLLRQWAAATGDPVLAEAAAQLNQ